VFDFFGFLLFSICSHQVSYCVPMKFPMGSQHNPQVFHVFLNMFLIAPHLITHALLNIWPLGTCIGRWAHIESDLAMKEGNLFCSVVMRSTELGCFRLYS
jgi:hypothetical protein